MEGSIATMTLVAACLAGGIILAFLVGVVLVLRGAKKLPVPEEFAPKPEGVAPETEEETAEPEEAKPAVTLEKKAD